MPDTARPTIPETITVHLGPPNSSAQNVTLTFPDYIKNVASSEIYPTWPEAAIRANIYVQVTFALNRVFTEWYRSRGYDFDITSSTQYDQAFVYGRDVFNNISQIVDEIFNNYVVRQGNVEPLFTQFCNGTSVTCQGLSQWGTVTLRTADTLRMRCFNTTTATTSTSCAMRLWSRSSAATRELRSDSEVPETRCGLSRPS